MKRKLDFNDMPDNLKTHIFLYDTTYKKILNNVLKELIEKHQKNIEAKLIKIVVEGLKYKWYNNEYYEYLFPRVDFNIIIKAMKDEFIKNPINFKYIKFILRSLCYYTGSDGINASYLLNDNNINMYPRYEVDDNNGYNQDDTLETIKIETFNFLKDIIDDSKLDQFFIVFIDDNDIHLEDYNLPEKYNDEKEDLLEEYNSVYVFKNYDFEKQPHLYNYKSQNNYEKLITTIAKRLYIIKNGYNNTTIQIRHNYSKEDRVYYNEI